jgi:hypothetical protein
MRGIAPGPIEAARRAQHHALADAAGEQAVAVELDSVDPARTGWWRDGSGRDAGARWRDHEGDKMEERFQSGDRLSNSKDW